MKKILLVEDDKNISDMVIEYLNNEGFEIVPVYNGENAISEFTKDKFDLVLLDLMIPKINGMEVMKKIRETSVTPIVIMSAKDSESDKAIGLAFGADDYITKPFSLIELAARIKANIRRATKYNNESESELSYSIIKYKDLEINLNNYSVLKNGIDVKVTNKEFEILKLFLSNIGRVFTKEQIYNQVWNEQYYGDENAINVHIKRLREKIGDSKTTSYIKTLWGIGYKVEEE